jgi:hypothetical protein
MAITRWGPSNSAAHQHGINSQRMSRKPRRVAIGLVAGILTTSLFGIQPQAEAVYIRCTQRGKAKVATDAYTATRNALRFCCESKAEFDLLYTELAATKTFPQYADSPWANRYFDLIGPLGSVFFSYSVWFSEAAMKAFTAKITPRQTADFAKALERHQKIKNAFAAIAERPNPTLDANGFVIPAPIAPPVDPSSTTAPTTTAATATATTAPAAAAASTTVP